MPIFQVYMLRGIRKKWKQPLYYNFCSGATKTYDIKKILIDIITKCDSIGLKIVATVCDQGSNNVAAINSLINDTKEKYFRMGIDRTEQTFEIDDTTIIPLYDVPHLFKGIRNNFLKYDIHFIENGQQKIAKWSHLETLYRMDGYFGGLQLCPKLTENHVNPKKINKMKVSVCCQVFSHSVAVGINILARSGKI